MGQSEGNVANPLKTTRDGLTLFLPWGRFGRGYVVSSKQEAAILRRRYAKIALVTSIVVSVLESLGVELVVEYTTGLLTYIMSILLVTFAVLPFAVWICIERGRLRAREEQIMRSLNMRNVDVVGPLLGEGLDVDQEDLDLFGLIEATRRGLTDAARLLIEVGADVKATNRYGETALTVAAGKGLADVVELLTEKGAEVNSKDHYGVTALMAAARGGHRDVLRLLLKAGADLNATDRFGRTAMEWSAKYPDEVKLLKAHGAKLTLNAAASAGDEEEVRRLIEAGADINQKDVVGRTPLMTVVDKGRTDTAKLLIEAGADVNAKDRSGRTSLMIAAGGGQTDVVRLLLVKGANFDAADVTGTSAMRLAEIRGHWDVVELLKAHGARE